MDLATAIETRLSAVRLSERLRALSAMIHDDFAERGVAAKVGKKVA